VAVAPSTKTMTAINDNTKRIVLVLVMNGLVGKIFLDKFPAPFILPLALVAIIKLRLYIESPESESQIKYH
jgi:hypothetical protein